MKLYSITYFRFMAIFAMATLFTFSSDSQTVVINYSYDNAGNRIKRQVITDTRTDKREPIVSPQSKQLEVSEIAVYPNPTKGILYISISEHNADINHSISIHSLSGQQIAFVKVNESLTAIDISSQPSGMYILSIESNNNNITSHKIIKID